MPHYNVYIDDCDVLGELTTKQLEKELVRRGPQNSSPLSSKREKRNLLNEVSDFLRRRNQIGLAGRLEDLREELEL